MFQAEPILWLQAWASPVLTSLLTVVTVLGYARAYVVLVLFLAFAVRLRPALYILVALLLAGLAVEGLKLVVAFPRPTDVDARVVDLAEAGSDRLVAAGAATNFLGRPAPEALAAIRALPRADYGFPSGHVAGATALGAGLLLFFRRRAGGRDVPRPAPGVVAAAVAWPVLMACSRMYLGRHFLADVTGGFVIGAFAAVGTLGLALWFHGGGPGPIRAGRAGAAAAVAALAGAGLLAAGASWLDPQNAGRLVAVLAALAGLGALRHESDAGSPGRRGARFALALLLFLGLQAAAGALLRAAGASAAPLAVFATGGLVLAGGLLGTVVLGRRLGLYARPAGAGVAAPASGPSR